MSFAYLPLFTGDYLRDTRHLTPQKHGVYLLLLMHCWDQKGPVPLDEQEAAGIANCRSADEIDSLRYVLERYFVRMDDGWYNKRMQDEVERSEAISHARSAAGKLGYEARAKHLPSKSQANAKQVHLSPSPSPSLTSTPEKRSNSAELALAAAAPPPKVVELIPLNNGTDHPITEELVLEFERLYPNVDVPATLKQIRGWCLTNPAKRKTPRGVASFVNRWLSKEQDRG